MLVSQIYMAGDYIFAEGDVSTAMYFVARGRVQLSNGKHTTTINEGTYFGDGGCILQVARKSLAQSLTYVEIFALSNTLLVELCEDYSPLKESVEEKRQSLLAAAKEQGEEESTPNHLALQRGEGALTRSLGLMSPSVNASRSRTSAPAGQASSDATSSDAVPAADVRACCPRVRASVMPPCRARKCACTRGRSPVEVRASRSAGERHREKTFGISRIG